MGQAGLSNFCEMMDMPVLHHKTYLQHQKAIHEKSSSYSSQIMSEAVQIVRNAYPEQAGKPIIDIDVSYDGSWHTRGHKSNCGLGCVIENRTGLVVDNEVLSKFCQKCLVV
ncbi:hypothetical protein ElyMa_006827200 [Elysia marginata]|uniref:Mutator-like transposase domain-containing protein n=1 Tax=Elysia marginata TaxID=1093978 RepID=A0AAV4J499_9GAST|nr:hypothetical protein ElyMa_006827200 [Elysia marginata]